MPLAPEQERIKNALAKWMTGFSHLAPPKAISPISQAFDIWLQQFSRTETN
ncbi:hypothetical protein Cflav_PD5980 [Pedosphaera parvula Ellin514]|uniref:Uncharacterized protein n=1 Tax=Pedosphaera parvula (strain Ellin514) TaxID=320771 RepID=B9XA04_PEDPL|nr:hypothetical protein Cflav_PD5980 [Pedosphaera parvula Ellin514]